MSRGNIIILVLVAGFFLYGYFGEAKRDDSGNIESSGTLDAFSVKVGDCTNDQTGADSEDETVSTVSAVPCAEPHDNEFYASLNLDFPEYPGEEAITLKAGEFCLAQFEEFVGIDYDSSVLMNSYMYPTQGSWDSANDREVLCLLYKEDSQKLTGSAKGIGI